MYELIKYINNNITEKLIMSEIAEMSGYSVWHFCEKFKAITSMTFSEYIQNKRIQLAAREILKGHKIVDIANHFGYSNPSGFNKAFAKQYGCSPSQYKKNYFHYEAQCKEQQQKTRPLSTRCALLKENIVSEYTAKPSLSKYKSMQDYCRSSFPVIHPYDMIAGEFYSSGNILSDKQNELIENEAISIFTGKKEIVSDYSGILGIGFAEICKRITLDMEADSDIISVSEYTNKLGSYYISEAEKQKTTTENPNKKYSLDFIFDITKKVPSEPAITFAQALQSLTFAHMINTVDDYYGTSLSSIGRLDRLLYPYYANDLQIGIISEEEAEELLICFFLKLYHSNSASMFTIGGTVEENEYITTGTVNIADLTGLMIHALQKLNLDIPFAFRYSKSTDKKLFISVLKYIGKLQGKYPLLICDDINIPSLVSSGVQYEDACNYCLTDSFDIVVPGKTITGKLRVQCNLLKSVESVFRHIQEKNQLQQSVGKSDKTISGDSLYPSFSFFLNEIYREIDLIIENACKTCESNIEDDKISAYKQILNVSNAMLHHENVELPDQYKSKYVFTSITMEGIPNLIDSLCAVKYLVYENSLTTLDELAYHLKHDFPDEKYRQLLFNKPPEYGNNIPEVNQLSEQIFGFVCSCIQKYNTANLSLRPKLISFAAVSSHDDMRLSIRNCNATPDGRHKGEIIASGITPVLGSDFNGLTALLKSFAALPTIDATGGTSATVILDPYLLNDINLNRIADIFLSVAPNGLSCIRIEVTDTDTIKSSAFGQYENTISSDNTNTHTII